MCLLLLCYGAHRLLMLCLHSRETVLHLGLVASTCITYPHTSCRCTSQVIIQACSRKATRSHLQGRHKGGTPRQETPEKADAADQRFHQVISQATRNNAILISVENLWQLRRTVPQVVSAYSEVCSQGNEQRLKEHTAIYDAIANKDPAGARRAMHYHFNRLINALFDASEAKALEEIKRKTDETRDLYSISHLSQ